MDLLKKFTHIAYSEDSRLTINDPLPGRYNISMEPEPDNLYQEAWVPDLDTKIHLEKTGFSGQIVVMSKDLEILPYCMRDRLVSLQDRMNKGQI